MRVAPKMARTCIAALLFWEAVGCSTPPPSISSAVSAAGASSGPGDSSGATGTWTDGTKLSGSVTIAAGSTMTVAPGATIAIATGTTITVVGTLAARSASPTHAKLTGGGWNGIVVAGGGTLLFDGVDLVGASTALDIQKGAKAEYDDGNIDASAMPFNVEAGGILTTQRSTVTRTQGGSQVAGTFTAAHLDYNSGDNSGIMTT